MFKVLNQLKEALVKIEQLNDPTDNALHKEMINTGKLIVNTMNDCQKVADDPNIPLEVVYQMMDDTRKQLQNIIDRYGLVMDIDSDIQTPIVNIEMVREMNIPIPSCGDPRF